MNTSAEIGELAAALAAAQGELTFAAKDRVNSHFGQKYATLEAHLEAGRPVLSKHGLSVIQSLEGTELSVAIVTRLCHASGQWVESTIACRPAKADAQGVGSVASYCRRYAYAAIIGLASADDDGESAVDHTPSTRQSHANSSAAPSSRQEGPRPSQGQQGSSNGHSSDWSEAKGAFFADLGQLGIKYADLTEWLTTRKPPRPRPSTMVGSKLYELVEYLRGEGGSKFHEWLMARGSVPAEPVESVDVKVSYNYAAAEQAASDGDLPF